MVRLSVFALLLLLSGCGGSPPALAPVPVPDVAPMAAAPERFPPLPRRKPLPQIIATHRPLQCVPFARELSGIPIRGDAWTWWNSAANHFDRGSTPALGAVLVLKRTKRLRGGHLAVVRQVLNPREILVDQANWLNRGQIHLATPVIDVSPANDWSEVRVWYTPGARYGANVYPAHGFIYPERRFAVR